MAINYQFDVINPFQAALQGYGAGAQILQQERAAAQQARQAQMQEAQFAQQGQLFGIQMQEAQARLQTLQDERAKAQKAQEAATRVYDLLDQPDALMNVSAGDIAKIAVDNPELGKFIQEQKALLNTEQIKNEFNQQWSVAAALELKNIPQAQALLEQQAIAQENSGDVEKAKLTRGMIEQLNTPEGRDILKKSLFVSSSLLMPEQYDKLKTDLYNTVKLPLEVQKIQSDLAASAAAANGVPKPEDRMKAETDLRKEYTTAAKGYNETRTFFSQLLGAAQQKSSAGDTALITLFRKVLDPTSVVRESEFAQTAEGGGILQRVEAAGAGLVSGQKLTDAQRQDIINTAQEFMNAANAFERNRRKDFDYLINSYNLDPKAIYGSQPVGEVYKPGAAQNVPDYINMTMDQLKGVNTFGLTFDQAKAYNEALLYKIQQLKGAK